ncbi:class I SAM-dependent methyltransferase [Treponema sp. TIM-1]|uniref:methyltransferase n=1 Tax=Treponema sp. TIM-1 TaxID=2898417 RepID=UPI0039802CC8
MRRSWSIPKLTNTWSGLIPKSPLVSEAAEAYGTREIDFKFRGREYAFTLSQGLFSSADIDRGTRLLLKVLSQSWDGDMREGRSLPATILDAGSGVGVIGICAAGALLILRDRALTAPGNGPPIPRVRSQDRDELARCFTQYNALKNHIPPTVLEAYAEPLLAGPPEARWDLILSNLPAKAGLPVLEDFAGRAASLLEAGGRVMVVVVKTLAERFRAWIEDACCPLLLETGGPEHVVFAYGPSAKETGPDRKGPITAGIDLMAEYPAYQRRRGTYTLEGISYTLDSIQGAADFDTPSAAVETTVKLACRLKLRERLLSPERRAGGGILIHEPDQGHFPLWFAHYLGEASPGPWVFLGRNVLALEASRHNFFHDRALTLQEIVPAVDPALGTAALGTEAFSFIAAFPETVPQTNRNAAYWTGIRRLLSPGGIFLMALPSPQAALFDRRKPEGFTRLGDLKRRGYRALAYGR